MFKRGVILLLVVQDGGYPAAVDYIFQNVELLLFLIKVILPLIVQEGGYSVADCSRGFILRLIVQKGVILSLIVQEGVILLLIVYKGG